MTERSGQDIAERAGQNKTEPNEQDIPTEQDKTEQGRTKTTGQIRTEEDRAERTGQNRTKQDRTGQT